MTLSPKSLNCSIRGALLLAALAGLIATPGRADSLTVTGDVYYEIGTVEPQNPVLDPPYISPRTPGASHTSFQPTLKTGDVTVSGTDGTLRADHLGNNEQFFGSAHGKVYADATPGILRALAEATASSDPTAYKPPFAPSANPFYPASYASASAESTDSIHVYDPSLPLGAVVEYNLSEVINETIVGGCEAGYGGYCNGDAGSSYGVVFTSSLGSTQIHGAGDEYQTNAVAKAINGETVALTSYLSVSAGAYAGDFEDWGELIDSQDHYADASHTFYTHLDPITAGLQEISDSGYDYETGASPNAVPEPATTAECFAGGLLVVVGQFRRRRSRKESSSSVS